MMESVSRRAASRFQRFNRATMSAANRAEETERKSVREEATNREIDKFGDCSCIVVIVDDNKNDGKNWEKEREKPKYVNNGI